MKTKNKIKFTSDKINLTDEQIAKHKDFGKLMEDYQKATQPLYKTPLYKNKKVFLAVLLVGIVLYLVVETFYREQTEMEKFNSIFNTDSTQQTPNEQSNDTTTIQNIAPEQIEHESSHIHDFSNDAPSNAFEENKDTHGAHH